MSPIGNVVIGQSGGPTAVINQTLVGIVKACLAAPEVDKVYGAIHGIQGVLDGSFHDFATDEPAHLERVALTQSSALLSVRLKASEEICRTIFERFREMEVKYFFYIGGNDTAETTHIINEMARQDGYPLHCFHCPKTIDNDVLVTDHSPGFGSAAKWVTQAFMGDNLDNRALGGIKINITMGRNAGWLTASSILARVFPGDGPHLVYCPEVDFSMATFLADVTEIYRERGRCIVAMSEGIHGPNDAAIVDLREVDSHGNRQLSGSGALGDAIAERLKEHLAGAMPDRKHRVRADTFGYLQRCFPGVVSEVDAREARLVGEAAVAAALSGERSGSIALRRIGEGVNYAVECVVTPLSTVARDTQAMPRDWINAAGNDVVEEKVRPYLAPLVGELPQSALLDLGKMGG